MLERITLAVLAGGAGSRMGRPKGLLKVGGRPVLDHLLDRLAWPGPTLLVTAPGRQRPPAAARFDAEAVDPVPDQGPLRGLLTALDAAATPLLAVATVDMPGVTRDQFAWLAEHLPPGGLGLMTRRGDGQLEPFPLLLRVTAAAAIRDRLAGSRRSVHGLADVPGFAALPAPDAWPASAWVNLNTPGDLAAFEPPLR